MPKVAAGVLLYRLGRDPLLDPVRRTLARVLSAYQRAPVHFLADAGWGDFDWMASSLLRWLLLRATPRRARHWRAQPRVELPSSGWLGSAFVLGVWTALILAVDRFFPILPT